MWDTAASCGGGGVKKAKQKRRRKNEQAEFPEKTFRFSLSLCVLSLPDGREDHVLLMFKKIRFVKEKESQASKFISFRKRRKGETMMKKIDPATP